MTARWSARGHASAFDACRRALRRASGACLHLVCAFNIAVFPVVPALASDPGIVPDGRTQTHLSVQGATTDVHGATVHGTNVFNSFTRFDVEQGRTVNVHIPGQALSSINLVHGRQTQIDGTLNSVREGQIGGDLYLLNSHGVVVGPSGRVNTGAFHVQTPTREFMEGILDASGTPDAGRVRQITEAPHTIPLSASGVIRVQGQVNAVRSVDLHGASADVSGQINVGEAGRQAIRSAVNLQGIEPLGSSRGRVNIRTDGATRISGQINADGVSGSQGGRVQVRAGGNVEVAGGARISARGSGANSSGGTVLIRGIEEARFDRGAIIDVRAGTSGDGGFIDFSADRLVTLAGGTFLAGAENGAAGLVVIDPEVIRMIDGPTVLDAPLVQLATKRIEIAANVDITMLNGSDIVLAAPSIVLEDGVRLVSEVDAGGVRGDITLIAIAGNLPDEAYESLTKFQEAVGDYYGSGDIADLASLTETSFGAISRKAEIVVGENVTMIADTITLRAAAAAQARLYDKDSDGTAILTGESLADAASVLNSLQTTFPLGVSMLVSMATAEASIAIGEGARIEADRDVVIDADAIAIASPQFAQENLKNDVTLSLGGLFASASGSASIDIASGARLVVNQRGGASNIAITADVETSIDASGEYTATGTNPVGLGVTVAFGQSAATVNLADGSKILAGEHTDITIKATTKDSFSASTTVTASRAEAEDGPPGGGVAAIVTYADYQSEASVHFGAEGETGAGEATEVEARNLAITAASTIEKAAVAASGEVGDADPPADAGETQEVGDGLLDGLMETVAGAFNAAAGAVTQVIEGTSISGAIAIQNIGQNATATMARGARVHEDLTLEARVLNERIENRATVEGSIQDVSFGFALALPMALVTTNATAQIGPGGESIALDVGGALSVDATISIPGPQDVYDLFTQPFAANDREPNDDAPAIENLTFLDPVWDSRLYQFIRDNDSLEGAFETVQGDLFNSISGAQTAAERSSDDDKAKTLAIVLNNNIAVFENRAVASLGSGVAINQNDALVVTPEQSVSITASSDVEYLTWTGDARIGKSGGNAGGTALGVSFSLIDIDNSAQVVVGNGARISAQGDVVITATSDERLATVGYSANLEGGDVGINGAIAVNFVKGTADVAVGNDATLVSRAGDILISAKDNLQVVNIVGGVTQGENVGVGVGVAFNRATSNANVLLDSIARLEAFGKLDLRAENDGFVVAAGLSASLKVPEAADWASGIQDKLKKADETFGKAHEKLFQTESEFFAGFSDEVSDGGSGVVEANSGAPDEDGEASDTSQKAGENQTVETGGEPASSAGAKDNPLAKALSDATGKFGINISGDASVNLVTSNVGAVLTGAAGSTVDAGEIVVSAESGLQTIALAGAVTIKKTGGDDGKSKAAGLAGSYTHNSFNQNVVEARISDIGALTSDNVTVAADNRQQMWGIVAAGSGNTGGGRETANVAGSIAFNTMKGGRTAAEISDTAIFASGAGSLIDVAANDDALIVAVAGGVVYSGADTTVGIGAAGTVNLLETDTTARMRDVTLSVAPGEAAPDVAISATATRMIASVAMGVAVTTGNDSALAAAVSATYNSIGGAILAELSGGALDAGKLDVVARDASIIGSAAGDAAITTSASNSVTAGIATAINNMANSVESRIIGANVTVTNDAKVAAELDRLAVAVAAGVSVTKGAVSLKGSVAINLVDSVATQVTGVNALIGARNGTRTTISGAGGESLTVLASDRSRVHGYAGALSAGKGSAGIGAAIVVNVIENEVEARVEAADIDGLDTVTVEADVDTQIISAAASLGASQQVAVSGAIVVNVLEGASRAIVGAPARIGLAGSGETVGDFTLRAGNDSLIASAAGSGAISTGGAGIGGALTVDVYRKTTLAAMYGEASLSGSLVVAAKAHDKAYGGLAAFGVGSSAGIAGAVGVVVGQNATTAVVGRAEGAANAASVFARGNVIVDAYASSDTIRANVTVGVASDVGVGALIAVAYLKSTTLAEIGNGATVVGLGQTNAGTARTGQRSYAGLDLSATPAPDDPNADATADGDRIKGTLDTTTEQLETTDFAEVDPASIFAATNGSTQLRGVSVTADSDARMINLGLAVAGGGKAAVGASATATVSEMATTARIGADARINDIVDLETRAHADQDVNVRASSNMLSIGAAAGVAVAGKAAVGGGVDVGVGSRETRAIIDAGATVRARDAVAVAATSQDMSVSVAVGIGGGGAAGIGGAVAIGVSGNETHARIAANAIVEAGRVAVTADSATTRFQIGGSGGFGGTAGVGASVTVLVDQNRTTATIGTNAQVTARTKVVVDAQSYAAYRSFTVAAAGSGVAGVAASVAVKSLRSFTQAAIESGAHVVVSGVDADGRSVHVNAASEFELLSVTGGGGIGGKVGVGAGIDVMIGRATTDARIGENAFVSGGGDIIVEADARKTVDSTAVALGGGVFVGVAGAVNVMMFGQTLTAEQRSQLSGDGPDQIASVDAYLNANVLNRSLFDDSLDGNRDARNAGAAASANLARADTSADLADVVPDFGQTRAIIDAGATVESAGNISVLATDVTRIDVRSGGLGVGAVGVGLGAAVSKVRNTTIAEIGQGTTIRLDGDLTVAARDGVGGRNNVIAVTGAAGGFAGNLAIAISDVQAASEAIVGAGVTIERLNPILSPYSSSFVFRFTPQERALLRQQGMTDAAIDAEERRRTLVYHRVHERLIGLDIDGASPDPTMISEAEFGLYRALRGDRAFDPELEISLSPEAIDAVKAQIDASAQNFANARIAGQEADITAAVKAFDTPANAGTQIGDSGVFNVEGIYTPGGGANAARYWEARNIRQQGEGDSAIWVADAFPADYAFTFSDRNARIAQERQIEKDRLDGIFTTALDANSPDGVRNLYLGIHDRLMALFTDPGVGDYRNPPDLAAGAPLVSSAERDLYWRARNIDVSAGAITITALEANEARAQAYGGSIGGVAAGGQFALALKGGTVIAGVKGAGSAAGGASIEASSLSILAEQRGLATAFARGGNAGTTAAIGGVVAIAENRTRTEAMIGAHAAIATRGALSVNALAAPRVTAEAFGVNVSGGYSVGVSSATTRLSNAVSTSIGNAVSLTSGGDVLIQALSRRPTGADNARAMAVAGSGGALIGASGAVAINRVTTTVDAVFGDGVVLTVADPDGIRDRSMTLLASSETTADIEATGVGIGFVGIGAVFADNAISNTARTTVGSGLTGDVSGLLRIASETSESARLRSTSGSGGVVAGAAAVISNSIANTTQTTFRDGAAGQGVSARRIEISADHLRGYAEARSDSIRASLVGFSGAWAETSFTSRVGVTLGTGLLAKAVESLSVRAANFVEKGQSGGTINAGSGGLFDLSAARSRTNLDNTATLDVNGAQLLGQGNADISLRAINRVVVADTVTLDAGGAIAGAISESLVRNSTAQGDSASVRLGAGAVVETQRGSVLLSATTSGDIEARASSKTYGLAGGAGAKANAFYTASNLISIGGGARIEAGRDLDIIAGDPRDNLAARTNAFAYNKTAIPIATNPNVDTVVTLRNFVDITNARATAARDVTIDARGSNVSARGYGEAEDWTEAFKAALENIGRIFTGDEPKPLKKIVTGGLALQPNRVTIGANGLVQAGVRSSRTLVLSQIGSDILGNPSIDDVAGAIGFSVEKQVNVTQRIRAEIAALSAQLATEPDAQERDVLRGEIETLNFLLAESLAKGGGVDLVRDVITLDDVVANTGDVNIFTATLLGGGTVKTSRRLEIVVDNKTAADLRVGDAIVDSSRRGEVRLNGRSITSHGGVAVEIEAGAPGGPRIDIANSFVSPSAPETQPDLYVDGRVINRLGSVRLASSGSIVIGGDVEGTTLEILSAGSIVQRYRRGFSHIGGLPYRAGSAGSLIAGGNVFLAGEYLNINGTVQAGIPIRSLNLPATLQATVDLLDAVYAAYRQYQEGLISEAQLRAVAAGATGDAGETARRLTDDLLAAGDAAAVVILTSFLDPGQPIVSGYNLATREIEVQNTAVGGGLVTLFGHIISTGNGKIRVTDGFGELTVDNDINRDMVLFGFDTGSGVEGKVKIVDTAYADFGAGVLGRVTEISRNADGRVETLTGTRREVQVGGQLVVEVDWDAPTLSANASRETFYDPKSGQTYYVRVDTEGAKPACEQLTANCDGMVTLTGPLANMLELFGLPVPSFPVIGQEMPASQRIDIAFLGADSGLLDVRSRGNILLAGDLVNTSGETRIESVTGDILRRNEATIRTGDLTILAQQGRIGAADAADATGLWIALTGDSGLLQAARAGTGIALSERRGTLNFDQIDAGAGDADIRAADSILGVAGNLIKGGSISLSAGDGSIGSGAIRVNVDTGAMVGVLNASAADDIYLAEIDGDLRVDRIRAGGMVDLVVDRNLLDANRRNEEIGLSDDERIALWREAGLINDATSGDAAADRSRAQTIAAFEAKREREYREYWSLRNLRTVLDPVTGVETTTADPYDPAFSFSFSALERDALLGQGLSPAAIASIEAARTAAYHETHLRIGSPVSAASYDPGYSYVATQAEIDVLSVGYLWTAEELFGSINRALFSDRTDTDPFIEDPNVVAAAMRLDVGGNIGEIRGVFELTLPPPGQPIDPVQQAALYTALAQAEREDITYIYRRDGILFEVVGDQDPAAELVGIRIELKEDFDADIGGEISVLAQGDIYLGSEETDINLLRVESANGAVRLRSRQGIVNARNDVLEALRGRDVVLEATSGSIGAQDKRLVVDIAGTLTARTGDSIYLQQLDGDLAVDFVRATNVADILVSGGGIRDARTDAMTNVRARVINLDAAFVGGAGANEGLGIGQLGGSAARFNAIARNGGVFVQGTEGDVVLGQVRAQNGDIAFDILAGALLKGADGVNIVADDPASLTTITARRGVGTASRPLDLQVSRLLVSNVDNRDGGGRLVAPALGSIFIAERDGLELVGASNDAFGGGIWISAGDDLIIQPDGVVRTTQGPITLIAASDGAGGDVTHLAGSGRIDAGSGPLLVRAERIRLENPVIAGSMRFETTRPGQSMWFKDLRVASDAFFQGGFVDIASLAHTGGPGFLRLGFTDAGRPMERLAIGSLTSPHGVLFDPFNIMDGRIGSGVSRAIFPSAYIGRTFSMTTNETRIDVDQLSPAILDTGIQIHQNPIRPFFFAIEGSVFSTDAQIIKFDRRNLTAIVLSDQGESQFTLTAFDLSELLSIGDARVGALFLAARNMDLLDDENLRDPLNLEDDDAVGDEESETAQEEDGEGDGEDDDRVALACSSSPAVGLVNLEGACAQ